MLKFKTYKNSLYKVSLAILLLGSVIFTPIGQTYAEQAKSDKEVKGKAEAAKEKLDTRSELEKKIKKLESLYVPIHWSDYVTGMAVGGYDPLSYFLAAKAEAGDERFQYLWHGVAWQFTSEANLLAFKRTPSVYAPRFAGYDPYAISKGILSQGLPSIWVIKDGKLYLFHNQVNKYLWSENRKKLNQKIEENWQELSLDIPRFKVF